MDAPDLIVKKLKRAQTDSDNAVRYDKENKPGISNLMEYTVPLRKTATKLSKKLYAGKGYGVFKSDIADLLVATLEPIQQRYNELITSPELDVILMKGLLRRMLKQVQCTVR